MPTGKSATFTYDQDRLVSIARTDGGITQLGYDPEFHSLSAVRDSVTGYTVTYDYDGIITVSEYSSSTWSGNTVGVSESNLGQRMTIDRESVRQTVCRTPGKDAVYGNADDLLNIYQFDRYGKVITVSTTSAVGKPITAPPAAAIPRTCPKRRTAPLPWPRRIRSTR